MKTFSAKDLFSKTMPFIWAKMIMGIIPDIIMLVSAGIGVFLLDRGNPGGAFAFIIVAILVWGAARFLLRVVWFGIRVGHIAVITETMKTGKLPDNQVEYGKKRAKERMGTAVAFFGIHKLIRGAVMQLQRGLASTTSMLGSLPGMDKFVKVANTIIKVALKYVDACCIAWIFYGPQDQSPMKGALDGVTIYAQNWKKVLANAVKTGLLVVVLTSVFGIVIAAIVGALASSAGGWWTVYAILCGGVVALTIKRSFIDSYIMISMLVTFMSVAPSTQLKADMYGSLSNISPAFKKMLTGAQGEISGDPFAPAPASGGGSTVFCGQCGAKNPAGTRFCGECGQGV